MSEYNCKTCLSYKNGTCYKEKYTDKCNYKSAKSSQTDLEFINSEIENIENSLKIAKINKLNYPHIEERLQHLKSIKAKLEVIEILKVSECEFARLDVFPERYVLSVYKPFKKEEAETLKEVLNI